MEKLFVGNTDLLLSIEAKKFNPDAKLIEKTDIANLDNIKVGYISLGDHSINDFLTALELASELYYIPSINWDYLDTKLHTECWLRYFSHRKPVHNFNSLAKVSSDHNALDLVDTRRGTAKQLWVAGDSFTAGIPWVSPNETYSYILGKHLNLPVSVLAKGGSSISWAADQILRSDIHADDIVVLMLTGVHRFPYYDGKLNHIYGRTWDLDPKFNKIINKRILIDPHTLYLAYRSIEQLVHDARKVGYKLIITKTQLDHPEHEFEILNYLSQFKFFVHNYRSADDPMIDYSNDNEHPGPKQHQHYANVILEYLKNENIS